MLERPREENGRQRSGGPAAPAVKQRAASARMLRGTTLPGSRSVACETEEMQTEKRKVTPMLVNIIEGKKDHRNDEEVVDTHTPSAEACGNPRSNTAVWPSQLQQRVRTTVLPLT
eukprot:4270161-Pleurochrysis_carterae.AAC.1